MRKILVPVALIFVISILFSACESNPSHETVERIVVFGDSNVDSGNLFRLTDNMLPPSPNWRGRSSNGPTVVEYLAEDLDAALENYAVSGATTGDTNIVAILAPIFSNVAGTGVTKQIDKFINNNNDLSSHDLVILWVGSNDIFQIDRSDTVTLNQKIKEACSNIQSAVEKLHKLGAGSFVVALRTPRAELGTEDDRNGIDLNLALAEAVDEVAVSTGANVMIFDAYSSISDMMNNPSFYGFNNVDQLCIEVSACASEQFEDGLRVADGYVNWDASHKTTRVHRLMAGQILEMLQEIGGKDV